MNTKTDEISMVEREVVLAALLHDIGKFWQRCGVKEKHQELSRRFIDEIDFPDGIDVELISTLVLRHHDNKNLPTDLRVSGLKKGSIERGLARIVSDADNISSGMDREADAEGEADRPLIPIFCEVNASGDESAYSYKPEPLASTTLPEKGVCATTDITSNWNEFVKDAKIIGKHCKHPNTFLNNIYYLLMKHTSLVLSAGYRTTPDIPLFDHLKTTSAIALCLYRWGKENNSRPSSKTGAYLLIEGDLSGIQRFIFQIASPEGARAGMSKRLRGRSFWLTLMMDAIALKILDELNLPETNLLWNTGGHFIILAPDTEESAEMLEEIRKDINSKLLSDYDGNLSLALDWIECSANDLRNFSETRNELAFKINTLKQQKFIDCTLNFDADGENRRIKDHCIVCGDFRDGDMWFKEDGNWKRSKGESDLSLYCDICKKHEELGGKLAKADYIVRGVESEFDLFGIGYDFVKRGELDGMLTEYKDIFVYKLNDTNFVDADILARYPDAKFGFRFLGNTVPLDGEGDVLSFEYIGQMSKGADKLGVLKADVDDLGKIFAFGLESNKRSISRIHALSSMLELFFAGQLNEICKKHHLFYDLCESCSKESKAVEMKESDGTVRYTCYEADEGDLCDECKGKKINKLYITYSGGDDLLIVGPYDAIIEVASDIRSEFKRFACENPAINISCGIAVVDPHYPVARTVVRADEQLELAKSHRIHGKNKNSIALFNECIRWDESRTNQIRGFETIFDLAKELEKRVEDKRLSKGFVYSLLRMWQITFRDLRSLEDIENVRGSGQFVRRRYMPYLKYQLARTIRDKDERLAVEDMIKPCMDWIRIPVSWVSLRTRR